MANHFYVYELCDPRDNQVFYVGKGSGKRVERHAKEVACGRITNAAKYRRIKEIHGAGMTVVERVVESGLTEREAFRRERELIALRKGTLTNVSRGSSSVDDLLLEHAKIGIERCEWTIACHRAGHQFPDGWIDVTKEWLSSLRGTVTRLTI